MSDPTSALQSWKFVLLAIMAAISAAWESVQTEMAAMVSRLVDELEAACTGLLLVSSATANRSIGSSRELGRLVLVMVLQVARCSRND